MSANVFVFPGRAKGPQPWTNDELAELYRVVDLLGRAGLSVVADMGMSDEGDPWFVFCRADNGEVIAHFARIDGHFIAASIAVDETYRGANFRQIVDRMVSSQPLVVPASGSVSGGSTLLLHPAVLLTAFVATALAHSEKIMAQDWLRAVEAQWDHAKTVALNEVKHIKTGWLDTLQTLWKLPLHDSRLGHDSAKEGQALTLASMIAIALAALQPIVEKVAVISQIVADEFPGHATAASQGQNSHTVLSIQDGSVVEISGQPSEHATSHSHSGDDAPQLHKLVAASADVAADGQKATIDTSHAVAAAMVQKVAPPDDGGHVSASPIEMTADVNGAFILMQQKAAVMAQQQQTESVAIHVDSGAYLTPSISLQDVTPEALQILHLSKPDSTSSTASKTDVQPAGDVAQVVPDNPQAGNQPPPVQVAPPQPAGPQVLNEADVPVAVLIQAISDFASGAAHTVSQPGSIVLSSALQNELAPMFGSSSSLKVVFFDGVNTSAPDVFLFSPGVIFVAERDISATTHFSNDGGNLILNLIGGAQITLVGVTTIEHAAV